MNLKSLFKGLAVFVLVLTFVMVIWQGMESARKTVQAEVITANIKALTNGLDFFYSDFDRFPTVVEFQKIELMQNYFTMFPPTDIKSKNCDAKSFEYKRPEANSYEIYFCLPVERQNFKTGWNKLVGKAPL